ncbi:MAG TPA: gluconate 2-dehydrogenase subunit 3 family protein [Myxococcota bacterium]|nr:gluconate 2-dehydrogenase subunit 3 family protein [Myxococcota bacterium]
MSAPADSAAALSRDALACVLDLLIPASADGRLPAAGELGLAAYVEELSAATPGLRPLLEQGLSKLDADASTRGARGFAALAPDARRSLLDELAKALPAFPPTVFFVAMTGYYREPRVLAALGLEARPPFPKGHAVGETDFGLLERVRQRGKLYR